MEKAHRKKGHHRVNVDRKVWKQLTRRGAEGANFSGLVSALLESYVARPSAAAGRSGTKVSVDITVDDGLWNDAARVARAQGLALSHVLRELLQEHLLESRKRRAS